MQNATISIPLDPQTALAYGSAGPMLSYDFCFYPSSSAAACHR
jgi:hypothetical protein